MWIHREYKVLQPLEGQSQVLRLQFVATGRATGRRVQGFTGVAWDGRSVLGREKGRIGVFGPMGMVSFSPAWAWGRGCMEIRFRDGSR